MSLAKLPFWMLLPSIVVSYESNTAHRIILSESKSSQTTSDNRLFVSTPTKPNKLMQLRHARTNPTESCFFHKLEQSECWVGKVCWIKCTLCDVTNPISPIIPILVNPANFRYSENDFSGYFPGNVTTVWHDVELLLRYL